MLTEKNISLTLLLVDKSRENITQNVTWSFENLNRNPCMTEI